MNEANLNDWIRSRIRSADPALWVIECQLACSPRPLRYHSVFGGRIPSIPVEARPALLEWLRRLRSDGIGTIVVLATSAELNRYTPVVSPHNDLIDFYKSHGFVVHHHPVEDPAHARAAERPGILAQMTTLKPIVLQEFGTRSGAMLIHCSGGMDRTSPVAAYVGASLWR